MEDVPNTRDMRVAFFCKGDSVAYSDVKQMICHLLGVANEMLNSKLEKPVLFLYLLYSPAELQLSPENKCEIPRIYKDTCHAANNYCFEEMFGHTVLSYYGSKHEAGWFKRYLRKSSSNFLTTKTQEKS